MICRLPLSHNNYSVSRSVVWIRVHVVRLDSNLGREACHNWSACHPRQDVMYSASTKPSTKTCSRGRHKQTWWISQFCCSTRHQRLARFDNAHTLTSPTIQLLYQDKVSRIVGQARIVLSPRLSSPKKIGKGDGIPCQCQGRWWEAPAAG